MIATNEQTKKEKSYFKAEHKVQDEVKTIHFIRKDHCHKMNGINRKTRYILCSDYKMLYKMQWNFKSFVFQTLIS